MGKSRNIRLYSIKFKIDNICLLKGGYILRYHYLIFLLIIFLNINCKKEKSASTQPTNDLPVINNISIIHYPSAPDSVFRGDIGIELECNAYDNDGFIADYIWEATGGIIRGAAYHARWDAPTGVPGIYYVICTVKDNDNNLAREEFAIDVLNRAPYIVRMIVHQTEPLHQPYFNVGNTGYFYISGTDNEHDNLDYKFIFPDTISEWQSSNGFAWTAPSNLPYLNLVYGIVRDEYGAESKLDSIEIYVQ